VASEIREDPRLVTSEIRANPRLVPFEIRVDPRLVPFENRVDPRLATSEIRADPRRVPFEIRVDPRRVPFEIRVDPRLVPFENRVDPRLVPSEIRVDPRLVPFENRADPRLVTSEIRADPRLGAAAGFTAVELLLGLAVVAVLAGIGIPLATAGLDEIRTAAAARYLAGRIVETRLDALRRSARVGLRFEPAGQSYVIATYADGNQNGIRTAEIADGTDPLLSRGERLDHHFAGVRFALAAGVPDLDGLRQAVESDGVRLGATRILTLSPDGTATSGTLYVRGARGQYAVRVLGATARTRTFRYHAGAGEWIVR
jgi:type II secretory pathway pseudopilin PulG